MNLDLIEKQVAAGLAAYTDEGISTDDLCVLINPAACGDSSAMALCSLLRMPVLLTGIMPMDSVTLISGYDLGDLVMQANELSEVTHGMD